MAPVRVATIVVSILSVRLKGFHTNNGGLAQSSEKRTQPHRTHYREKLLCTRLFGQRYIVCLLSAVLSAIFNRTFVLLFVSKEGSTLCCFRRPAVWRHYEETFCLEILSEPDFYTENARIREESTFSLEEDKSHSSEKSA